MRKTNLGILAAIALLAAPPPAGADDYPSKPVRVITQFLAGGAVDVSARILAPKLSEYWGKPVVVENRVGGGGAVGSLAVATAEPDGHTLLFSPQGPLSFNSVLYKDLPYDPPTAFASISAVGRSVNFLIVGRESRLNSVADLLAAAKAAPGKINYASQGNATTPHLTGALLAHRAGIDIVHVPYRGFPPAVADLIGGQIDFMFADTGNTLPQLRSGQVRVLGVATRERVKVLSEVATLAEAGVPDVTSQVWFMLAAPAKTPPAVIAKIHESVTRAAKDPDVIARYAALGIELIASTPQEMAKTLADETTYWSAIIRATGVKVE